MDKVLGLHEMNERLIINYCEFIIDTTKKWDYTLIIREQQERDLQLGVEYE